MLNFHLIHHNFLKNKKNKKQKNRKIKNQKNRKNEKNKKKKQTNIPRQLGVVIPPDDLCVVPKPVI